MPPAPENVQVERTTLTTLQVTWDEPKIPVAGYRIYYNLFDVDRLELWDQIDIGPYTVAEITGLETHTSYGVKVQAKSADGRLGNLSKTVVVDFIPFPEKDDVVTQFRVVERTSREITLAWDAPKKPNVNNYRVSSPIVV